jgi:hypothetical protein
MLTPSKSCYNREGSLFRFRKVRIISIIFIDLASSRPCIFSCNKSRTNQRVTSFSCKNHAIHNNVTSENKVQPGLIIFLNYTERKREKKKHSRYNENLCANIKNENEKCFSLLCFFFVLLL